jgi:chromosome segregation ATPase
MQSLNAQIETLRLQYDKLFNDNNEMKIKFKTLEDEQQQQQIPLAQTTAISPQNEYNYENLIEKLNSIKNTYDQSVVQMQTLNEQLSKCKDQINVKDREITRLKSQLTTVIEQQQQQPEKQQQQPQQNENWNKEVRNLDARISDVLGKIKERELLLNHNDDWVRKYKDLEKKYEIKNIEVKDLNKKLNEISNENECLKINFNKIVEEQHHQQSKQRKISLHDFDDDLGKVLMSKEEVITQLEKSIEDKDKQIYNLNDDLQQNNVKYQELVQNECKKSQNIINETIQHYTNSLNHKEYELEQLNNELNRLNLYVDEQDVKINELNKNRYDLENKINTLNETSRNEIENLQEEVKTLEFKLAHSQKELCDYKNLLNSIDLSSCSSEKVGKLEQELNDVKNENNYLNEHIFALDEFIRDKETQNDLYEDEIKNLKCLNQTLTNEKDILEQEFSSNFILYYLNNSNESVKDFCQRLNAFICILNGNKSNKTLNDVDFNNDQDVLDVFNKPLNDLQIHEDEKIKNKNLNLKKLKIYLHELKQSIKNLEKYYSNDINKYNQNVLTYITEQIVHKATLNGHLKFACELLRKKCTDSLILIPNVPSAAAAVTSSTSTTPTIVSIPTNNFGLNNQITANSFTQINDFGNLSRDEKICKIAGELLLCDEDSLRK